MTSTSRRRSPDGYLTKLGYRIRKNRDHPIAQAGGLIFVHRERLYDHIGPGRHRCTWCGRWVYWEDGTLVVDHLNEVTADNRLENLAQSCVRCNLVRAFAPHKLPRRNLFVEAQMDTIEWRPGQSWVAWRCGCGRPRPGTV
jgi:hypothetical protein